jgi:hypothetical protein
MLVCGRPRLGDPIWHNLCSASHAASPDFAGIVCALCTNAMHPVFCKIENALRSCRSATRWDIHPRCGVRLPRPFAFAASRIADRHQARPEGSALTTAWWPARSHSSTSDFTRSSHARLAWSQVSRSSFLHGKHCFSLLLSALERLRSVHRLAEHGNDLPTIVL